MKNESQETADAEAIPETKGVERPLVVQLPILETKPIEEEAPANSTLITFPTRGEDWDFSPPATGMQYRIQEDLKHMGAYPGRLNGNWGNLSVYAIQSVVGLAQVQPDRELCILIQAYSAELGGYDRKTERAGYLTPKIWEAFAEGLEQDKKH